MSTEYLEIMTSLGDIINIAYKIKAAPFASIKIVYKLIFEEEGDKRSRKRIREFRGFDFTKGSKQYEAKLKFIDENFSVNDLTLISLILDLNHNEAKDKLIIFICDSLLNVDALRDSNYNNEEEEDEEEDKDDVSEIQVNNDDVNLEDDKKDEEDSEEEDEEEDQIESTAIRNKTNVKKTRRVCRKTSIL
ncbi:hypothetical protein O3M35_005240 [Rhynocoris fuscipes]|uniref:Uncharacterized protein n=1 Tax=Rhynocoris fuscipes TaxID=488301 RepID=A0AAW1DK83_9HEMI